VLGWILLYELTVAASDGCLTPMIAFFAFVGIVVCIYKKYKKMPLYIPEQSKTVVSEDVSLIGTIKKFAVYSNDKMLFEYSNNGIYVYSSDA
jgi:hypothetical protein